MSSDLVRRRWLKTTAVAIACVPLASFAGRAKANTNAAKRAEVKYQAVPVDGKECSSCLEFVPGKGEKDLGGCKLIPGDTEISPNGYCVLWNTM